MTAGRKPKPIEAHIKEGTLGTRQLSKTPLVVGGRKKPTCPNYLTPMARRAFRFLVNDIWGAGILDHIDTPLLIEAAIFFGRAIEAAQEIKERGIIVETERGSRGTLRTHTVREINPAVKVERESWAQFNSVCERIGVGPAARARLAHLGVKAKEPEKDIPGICKLRELRAVSGE